MLTQISLNDVHRITSGQVIVDLKSSVKEIIENAIDAHATRLEITVKNYGTTSVEISDNGDGIEEQDHDKLCLNHYTSKISSFADVHGVTTFGFRGEAMSSLCGIADLTVTTTTGHNSVATKLFYDHRGNLKAKSKTSRHRGTTVLVENLFANLPVRQKNFVKHSKKEFIKMIQMVQQFCIITGVRFVVYHITDKKKLVLSTSGGGSGGGQSSMLDNIRQVYNAQFATTLEILDLEIPKYDIHVIGYISNCSFGQGRTSGDRQMVFINNRPVLLPKLNKLINEIYKTFNHLEIPSFFLNLTINTDLIDINVTPDKMTVLISKEFEIFESLKSELLDFFNRQDHIIPKNVTAEIDSRQSELSDYLRSEDTTLCEDSSEAKPSQDEEKENSFAQIRNAIKRKVETSSEEPVFKRRISLRIGNEAMELDMDGPDEESLSAAEDGDEEKMSDEDEQDQTSVEDDIQQQINSTKEPVQAIGVAEVVQDSMSPQEQQSQQQTVEEAEANTSSSSSSLLKADKKTQLQSHEIHLSLDLSDVLPCHCPTPNPTFHSTNTTASRIDDIELSDLNTSQIAINKSQFEQMSIIGQFNLGFIIVSLMIQGKLNIFIVDQHASDEKYNFETLMANTVLSNQKLIRPVDLQLNSVDELVVLDNMHIFNKNGFQVNDSLQLTSIPMSKNVVFSTQDFEELIHLIKTNPHNPSIRPSKVYRMFASRACRSSTMIGDHLTVAKMGQIVSQLSTITKPWNCPHGRPTMRHLIELDEVGFTRDYA